MNKSKIISLIAVLGILTAGAYYVNAGGRTLNVSSKKQANNKISSVSTLQLIDNPYISIGGSQSFYYTQPTTASSTMPCAVYNPFGATSTVSRSSLITSANGIGAVTIDISTSSTAYGSSSPALVRAGVIGSGSGFLVWTPSGTTTNSSVLGLKTNGTGSSDVILGPTDWLTFRIATSSTQTYTTYLTGTCAALINKL